jgi:hypothetical protein
VVATAVVATAVVATAEVATAAIIVLTPHTPHTRAWSNWSLPQTILSGHLPRGFVLFLVHG